MSSVLRRPALGPRVRGLRIKELPRDKLISLIYANTLDEFLNILKTTPYSIAIDKLTRENLDELRRVLIKKFIERARSIYLGAGSEAKTVILASVKYFEYENIRNISNAVRAGRSAEEFIIWEPLEMTKTRHIVASLLGVRNIWEVGEKLKQMKHRAYKAFELASRYGEDKLSIFLDRQWLESFYDVLTATRDKSAYMFASELVEYFNSLIAIRARVWGFVDEVNELIIGGASPVVISATRDPPANFLKNAEATSWGRILVSVVAESPSLGDIAVAMDNIYPAYMRKMADIYITRFTEFSLGALAAIIEYMRAEVMTLIRAASLLAEGVPLEKRRRIFEALVK